MTPTRDEHRPGRLGYLAGRVARHVGWARTQGIGRLVEEDGLDLRERFGTALTKRRWRRVHGVAPGTAVPVWLVGAQRSGTNMLVRGLELAPEFEVHNENDRRVFDRFELRSDAVVAGVVAASRHPYVLLKPLCDSHRVPELLRLPGVRPGRALWAYRDVDGRARSAVAKFGDANLQALRRIADGTAGDRWQAQRLSEPVLTRLRAFDYDNLSPHSAAALFWWARNNLYFDLGLDQRVDVLLCSYDRLVADPRAALSEVASFLDIPLREQMYAHVDRRGVDRPALDLDPGVRELCTDLRTRLDACLLPVR